MIDKILKKHPSFLFADEIIDICSPLSLLNINYFAHVNIDAKKQFSAISSNPYFSEHYLNNHYYNADIHMSDKNLGNTVMWDFVKLDGKSKKMHSEAAEFGIKHTFTIIQKNNTSTDYYHFASNANSDSINQTYLSNLDLLKIFIFHFKEKISQGKHLTTAYQFKIYSKDNLSDYNPGNDLITPDIKSEFIKNISWNKTDATHLFMFDAQLTDILSPREQECLYFYIHGKSPREISEILFLSKRTIEQYMENIKIKLNVQNKAELIENVLHRFYMHASS